MRPALTQKEKEMAYELNRNPNLRYSQKKIAELMEVSQTTVSHAVREVEHGKQIRKV